MWYPNRNQWWVIFALTAVITFLGYMSLVDGDGRFAFFTLFFDAGILIWWYQRNGSK